MSLLYMSARSKRLLDVLLEQSDYLSLNHLAKALDVSRRTVYYDISKVNIWLEQAGLPALEIVREKGLFVPYGEREEIQAYLETDNAGQAYIFSPEERCKGIVCYIIYSESPVYLEQLTECFEVSRNTVFKDLKAVAEQLGQYELKLDYQARLGYQMAGDPVRIRALFMLYFSEMSPLFQSGAFRFFQPEKIKGYYGKMKEIEAALGINYVDGVLFSLAALIPILYRHQHPILFPGLKASEMQKTREYGLARSFFPDLPLEEQSYLALHLLGSRINTVPTEFFANPSKGYIHDLAKELITEFEKIACVVFEEREALERALFLHLSTSLYRYQYGIQIGNLMGKDVVKEYPDLFSITSAVVKKLETNIGGPIPDSEIAYLSLHFGSFLKISEGDSQRLRILIVCANGTATGNMLKREVQKLLPFAEIVDVRAAIGLMNVQDVCDLVISTVKINSVVPNIVVHPILTEFDRRGILNHKLIAPKQIEIRREQIFQVVKNYVDPRNYKELLNDLTAYLQGGIWEFEIEDKLELGLCKLLDADRIQIISGTCGWQQGIRIAGQSLIDSGSIEQRYLDAIISQLQYYGPYMFLTDRVILAHAKPEDGVNALDISFVVCKEPVIFSEERKASIIIMLAAEDQEKHLKMLQDILELVSNANTIGALLKCSSPEEALLAVHQLLGNGGDSPCPL